MINYDQDKVEMIEKDLMECIKDDQEVDRLVKPVSAFITFSKKRSVSKVLTEDPKMSFKAKERF